MAFLTIVRESPFAETLSAKKAAVTRGGLPFLTGEAINAQRAKLAPVMFVPGAPSDAEETLVSNVAQHDDARPSQDARATRKVRRLKAAV